MHIRAGVDIDKCRTIVGCPGCQAMLLGGIPRTHSDDCRRRIKDEDLVRRVRDVEAR